MPRGVDVQGGAEANREVRVMSVFVDLIFFCLAFWGSQDLGTTTLRSSMTSAPRTRQHLVKGNFGDVEAKSMR